MSANTAGTHCRKVADGRWANVLVVDGDTVLPWPRADVFGEVIKDTIE